MQGSRAGARRAVPKRIPAGAAFGFMEEKMRSDLMKKGIEKAPHRSLLKAMGYTDLEISRPLIGIVNSANEIIPGHIHLNEIVKAASRPYKP